MIRRGLPVDLTSFIGRTTELEQLTGLMERSRLVTLTGAAGSGKTRLALELVGGRLPAERPVAWAELAALRDPGLIGPVIAEAMGLREEVRPGGLPRLVGLIGEREALLVLDNCEHLVEGAAATVDALLQGCPGLSILATSREALGVRGERAWLVPPLALPQDTDGTAEATSSEAVRLFVDRVQDVVPDFALTAATTPTVVEICRRLDGIPLAIELAAARVRVLQPAEILARLDDVFRLLTDGRRTAVPRHRTLRAAIDWSHDLLTEPARVLLRRLAVFRGGLTLEAAEAVGAGGVIEQRDVLELVARLVDRSMLVVREQQGFARYQLLEAVRQYATEKLVQSGEEPEVRRRHAEYFLARVEEAEPHLTRRERRAWMDRLEPEIDNLRSALGWSRDAAPAMHLRLVGMLWWFWFSTHHWTEGADWIEGALDLPEAAAPTRERAALIFAAGALAALQVRPETARPTLREAAALARDVGDERLRTYALNYLGLSLAGEGSGEGAEVCRQAEEWFRAHDDLYGLRLALLLQGSSALGRGEIEEAERLNREGVRVAREFGQDRELAVSLQNLSVVLIVQRRLDEAETLVREALTALRRDPAYYFLATGIGYLGEVEGLRGRALSAARLMGAAEAIRERVGARPFPMDARRTESLIPVLRSAAGESAFERAWAEGRALSPESLLAEVTSATDAAEPADVPGPSEQTASLPARETVGGGPVQPALRVEALGRFRVVVEGAEVGAERWPYAKPRELLVYLLLHPEGRTRDQIGEALWPGAARSNVKNSFHVTLHHLRKALGHPEWVGVEGERYRLDPGVTRWFDGERLEAGARRARGTDDADAIRDVLGLYRGELLEGEVVGRWIDEHRDRLRRLHVELSLALGKALEQDDPAAATELYRALAGREELDEEIHRRLMSSWARTGDRVSALRHYDRLVELLRDTLDAEPEPETRTLYDQLRAGQPVG